MFQSQVYINILNVLKTLPKHVNLIAISKTHSTESILEAYKAGQRAFGENKAQELIAKQALLPKDIEWHFIGHLQSNKIKQVVPMVSLIHSIESVSLLQSINKEALKCNKIQNCLLQIHIATEETKFGLNFNEAIELINSIELKKMQNIKICGLMGMATFTDDKQLIRNEFKTLKSFYDKLKEKDIVDNIDLHILSMGMSDDYLIAIEEGSNMIRLGTSIFGNREYKI